MLSIKLQRIGRRHQPSYRVVVAESRSKLIAPPVEDLGSYNPFTKAFAVKGDRVTYWISKGAQATDSVHNLLAKNGIVSEKPRKLAMPPKDLEKIAAAEAAAAEKAAAAAARAAEAEAAAAAPAEEAAEAPVEEAAAEDPAEAPAEEQAAAAEEPTEEAPAEEEKTEA